MGQIVFATAVASLVASLVFFSAYAPFSAPVVFIVLAAVGWPLLFGMNALGMTSWHHALFASGVLSVLVLVGVAMYAGEVGEFQDAARVAFVVFSAIALPAVTVWGLGVLNNPRFTQPSEFHPAAAGAFAVAFGLATLAYLVESP